MSIFTYPFLLKNVEHSFRQKFFCRGSMPGGAQRVLLMQYLGDWVLSEVRAEPVTWQMYIGVFEPSLWHYTLFWTHETSRSPWWLLSGTFRDSSSFFHRIVSWPNFPPFPIIFRGCGRKEWFWEIWKVWQIEIQWNPIESEAVHKMCQAFAKDVVGYFSRMSWLAGQGTFHRPQPCTASNLVTAFLVTPSSLLMTSFRYRARIFWERNKQLFPAYRQKSVLKKK